ncbi:Subtilisin-like protease 3 [Linum grandiflorum]
MKSYLLISLTLTSTFLSFFSAKCDLDTYIVFLDKPAGLALTQSTDLHGWYNTFLPGITSNENQQRVVHYYRNVITGFAARLTPEEAKEMEHKEGFVSARVERSLSLHTTYTPQFLGLQQILQQKNIGLNRWSSSNLGRGIIIGLIDSGIKHDHPSFGDEDMPPPPARWKGKCEINGKMICNNKLIGARSFPSSGNLSEEVLHGTHTAGEAAGTALEGANVFGQANGTAMGIAPFAHLAMYKVCVNSFECMESTVLAAMDAAIEDGVDVLSLSLGNSSDHLYDDVIALGAFRAIQNGIFVSCSAGNGAPDIYSVVNGAPWILTVGASTIDRDIRTTVTLGNNEQFHGQSSFQPKDFILPQPLPIVDASMMSSNASTAFCEEGSLKNIDVRGKIVLCQVSRHIQGINQGKEVKENGGVGMILINGLAQGYTTQAEANVLPASNINYKDGLAIKAYLNSTSSPTATISFRGTSIGKLSAPQVAFFSSRGPSKQSPGILKPDIIGPGVSILGAWAESVDNSINSFNLISGTSMSCPHLSGVASVIKAVHPNWSPAAIKSAILTTAYTVDLSGKPISNEQNSPATVFDMGAGHVNPPKALDPGLIYDIQPDDYVAYICSLGYSDTQIRMIVQRKVKCSNESTISGAQLNYPTYSISLGSSPQIQTRTVTNVGMPDSTYTSKVFSPEGVDVKVTPTEIKFKELKEKATYSITFSRIGNVTGTVSQGSLVWSSADERQQKLLLTTVSAAASIYIDGKGSIFVDIQREEETNMKSYLLISLTLTSTFLSFFLAKCDLNTYIVFLEKPAGLTLTQSTDLHGWYNTFLPGISSNENQQRVVHYYRNVITGFAARLTPEEAKAMEYKEGFVSARVERSLSLHTTYTPQFLGLQKILQQKNIGLNHWSSSNLGRGIIIGVVDGGIKHDHPSFGDEGMPPPPARWKGKCEINGKMTCNNKLIGARSVVSPGNLSEVVLHGTHTAGEAAGTAVEGANVFGQADGTAMGIAPFAHLAMYKVCTTNVECFESTVLAGMDAAIEDGVDVLSLSLGSPSDHLYDDMIALGAFRAIQNGIFVSCSAGNGAPDSFPVLNGAPWILTVGASTIDRDIRTTVTLGNNAQFHGQSSFQPKDFVLPQPLPIVDASMMSSNASAAFCEEGSLKNIDVRGKIVLCQVSDFSKAMIRGKEVKENGGAAMILINGLAQGYTTEAEANVLPASNINYKDGLAIKAYLNSTSSPTATISFRGTSFGKLSAPQIAFFSSRGPSKQSPGILKPDIIGPGVSILGAWAESVDNSTNSFTIVSGTSMSCPHLSGVAAVIKAMHPDWSPAAIKSAILTTAYTVDLSGKPISNEQNSPATVFDMGAGHVNPPKAMDPGLIYDILPDDYVAYICSLGYNDTQVRMIVQRKVKCSNESSIPGAQLNYPTHSISLGSSPQIQTRTVTNVGMPDSTYRSKVFSPYGVDVKVTPTEIKFKELKEKATYSITFSRIGNVTGTVSQGSLVWSSADERYNVVSTIAVVFV